MASAITKLQRKLDEVEALKSAAIKELLLQREEINSQLRELGHKRGRKPGRKRGRPKGSRNKKTS
jgi:hypothetical protein